MAPHALTSVVLTTLLGSAAAAPIALANVPDVPLNLYRDILSKRDPPRALAESATSLEKIWQPALDFDMNGCYNTPAIGPDNKPAEGMLNGYTGGGADCHDESDLDNNNVYVRTRCNNGWCAYVYDYYFEKDTAVEYVADIGGHRHDWEHIIVFTYGNEAQIVAASAHGDYDTRSAGDPSVRWDDGTHPKIVYHKDGGSTHCFRFAHEYDDRIENHKGVWFRGALVNWQGLEDAGVRDTLVHHNFGKAHMAIGDDSIKMNIDYARNGGAPGFDSGWDEVLDNGWDEGFNNGWDE